MPFSMNILKKRSTSDSRRDLRKDSSRSDSHSNSHAAPKQKHIPLIASPLDEKASAWLKRGKKSGNFKLGRRPTIAQYEADHTGSAGRTIFRKHHEASTVELFFDLFFVANLAIFTGNHAHVDGKSVTNYLGFFSLLWFTWFQHSMYDVRFSVDSIFNRFCKIISMGVMVSFVGLGPIFDTLSYGGESRAFHGVALALMISRLMLFVQYGIILWYVKGFHKTIVPVALIMLVYLAAAMCFLATFLDRAGAAVTADQGKRHVIAWYITMSVEAAATIVISIFYRVVSFKNTHLVERVGLLTLIVMGEGIIGLVKSISTITKATNISVLSEIAMVTSAVMLIYFMSVLYFDSIEHERFGTIRQQIWALLHYPLHIAILLTVEGSTSLLIWNACMMGRTWVISQLPNVRVPSLGFNTVNDFVNGLNTTYTAVGEKFHYEKIKDFYDIKPDLDLIKKINETYGSDPWNEQASAILHEISDNLQFYLFENFQVKMPKSMYKVTDVDMKLQMLYDASKVVFIFFYCCAGALLLVMATMFWFGKTHKNKYEFGSILIRVVPGLALPMVSVVAFIDKSTNGFRFTSSAWIIPIVTFVYLAIIFAENAIAWSNDRHESRRRSTLTVVHDVVPAYPDDKKGINAETRAVAEGSDEEGVSLVQFASRPAYMRETRYVTVATDSPEMVGHEGTFGTSHTTGAGSTHPNITMPTHATPPMSQGQYTSTPPRMSTPPLRPSSRNSYHGADQEYEEGLMSGYHVSRS